MSGKSFLPTTLWLLIITLSATIATAQRNAAKGRLFMFEPRPRFYTTFLSASPGGRHPVFRSYDGKFNNVNSMATANWGAADIILFRELPAAYGPSDPKNAMGGINRPSARKISNVLIDEPVTAI